MVVDGKNELADAGCPPAGVAENTDRAPKAEPPNMFELPNAFGVVVSLENTD